VLDLPIRVPREPLMANALGAAFIAAVGLGYMTFDEVAEHIDYAPALSPNPANRKVYDDRFAAFLDIYKQLRPVYRRWNRSLGGPRG
jgi:xylulokinase